jgi:hypothetical protein
MRSVAGVVWQATGEMPVTCPPFTAELFPAKVFEGMDFIWLGLHGTTDDSDNLYGDSVKMFGNLPLRVPALNVEQIVDLDLSGAVVFASTCHLPSTAFPAAFQQCGAQVIGGAGENYGNRRGVIGADLLGATLINVLSTIKTTDRIELKHALSYAKTSLHRRRRADRDAMGFEVL